ncbi:MAG: decaprenyl-phosphate phosphoribosyltransferase [Candidatus Aegiribacteria sp.]|jgi:4-hydroxybenzoate polyprenyltransferase|nr:decaprenyl-phosphate phosphoribosyltransferase [Candidatus Aegiribacteria sp.]
MKTLSALLKNLRIRSWTKNLFVFAGILFGNHWDDPRAIGLTALGALGFCLLSSSVYLINDIADRDRDKCHPEKKNRPIASGALPVSLAAVAAFLLASGVLITSWILAPTYALVLSIYLIMQLSYSFKLKHVVILDVLIIAAGFVLRALAGVTLAMDAGYSDISISHWLIVCTFFLAIFLAFAKRRYEVVSLGENAAGHREILEEYSISLLDELMGIATAASIIGYSIYSVSQRTMELVSTKLWLTIPFVTYGIFRYLYLIHIKGHGGSPDRIILTDKPLLLNILLWVIAVALALTLFPGTESIPA